MRFPEKFKKRAIMTTAGVILCAASVGLFQCSSFGVDPFQCFAQGLWGRYFAGHVSYGTYYLLLSVVLLAVDLAAARRLLSTCF